MVIGENVTEIIINNMEMYIPSYFQKVDSMPDDPEGSMPYMCQTENTLCFAMLYPVDESQALPRDKGALIDMIRSGLDEKQGIIQVETEQDYVFSIVKTERKTGGVVYSLNYQRYAKNNTIINVQGFFEESAMLGYRDAVIHEKCVSEGLVGAENDRFKGWTVDPYDENYQQGALMNLSEKEEYDEMFPKSPLSMCRELVRVLNL